MSKIFILSVLISGAFVNSAFSSNDVPAKSLKACQVFYNNVGGGVPGTVQIVNAGSLPSCTSTTIPLLFAGSSYMGKVCGRCQPIAQNIHIVCTNGGANSSCSIGWK